MPRSSALRAYRRRVKTSVCRGLKRRTCKGKMGCKYVSGSKRKFCRKSGNTKRYSMSLRKMRGGYKASGWQGGFGKDLGSLLYPTNTDTHSHSHHKPITHYHPHAGLTTSNMM